MCQWNTLWTLQEPVQYPISIRVNENIDRKETILYKPKLLFHFLSTYSIRLTPTVTNKTNTKPNFPFLLRLSQLTAAFYVFCVRHDYWCISRWRIALELDDAVFPLMDSDLAQSKVGGGAAAKEGSVALWTLEKAVHRTPMLSRDDEPAERGGAHP